MKLYISILLMMGIFVLIFSAPVWKKNSFAPKQEEKRRLDATKKELLTENLLLDRQINFLSKPEKIEKIARDSLGLIWGHRPLEVDAR